MISKKSSSYAKSGIDGLSLSTHPPPSGRKKHIWAPTSIEKLYHLRVEVGNFLDDRLRILSY